MSFFIIDLVIIFCQWLDTIILATFGRFMPQILASFSFTLLIYTLGSYLNDKRHWILKMILGLIAGIYSLYKIYVWQIAQEINTPTTILLVFVFIVYPLGLYFTMSIFKDWRIFDIKVFNYITFWLIYFAFVFYFWFTDSNAISLEFCLIYAVFSFVIVYLFGRNDYAN
jgi:hypothetical protein